ncbi:lipopolysaccharide biosynthesis protein [Providencia rettgeri]
MTTLKIKAFHGASYTLIGNLSFAFAQWCILIIINKLGTANDVGIFTLSLAILNPLFMLAQGGLRAYIVIDTTNQFYFEVYLKLRIILSIFSLIISAIYVFNESYIYPVLLLGFYKLIDCVFDIFYGEYQRTDTMKKIAISRSCRAVINVVSFLLSYLITKSLNAALLSYIISSLIIFLIYDYRKYNFNPRKVNLFDLKELLILSFPLAITALFISLNTSIPRLFLESKSGLLELGAFGSFMYIISVAQIIIQSVCQAFTPKIASAYNRGNKEEFIEAAKTLLYFTIFISIIFCIFSIILKKVIFTLIFNKEYILFYDLYDNIILVSPLVFLCLVIGNINTARRRIKYQPLIFLLILITNIPVSYISIMYLGANGAVLSTLLSSILTIILLSIYSIKGREG